MNLLALFARTTPGYVDAVRERADSDNRTSLLASLRTLVEFGNDWDANLRRQLEGDLPSARDIYEAVELMDPPIREHVAGAFVLRLNRGGWESWVRRADMNEGSGPSRWVGYADGGWDSGGIVLPQDNDPTPNLAGFQYDATREHQLLVPLEVGVGAQPPFLISVTETEAAGCEMDDDGECVQDTDLCTASCALTLVLGQAGDALACRCKD